MQSFREQGYDDTKLRDLATDANFIIFCKDHVQDVEDSARLGLVVRDIAARENLGATDSEISEELENLKTISNLRDIDATQLRYEHNCMDGYQHH